MLGVGFCGEAILTTTVLIADDHPLFRDAIKSALTSQIEDENGKSAALMLDAKDFSSAMTVLEKHPAIDLLLLDLNMPGTSGLSALVSIRALYPAIPVLIVSASDDVGTIRRSIELGASGFISKSSSTEEIRAAVDCVMAGNISLPENMEFGPEHDPEVADLIERIKTLTPQQARVLNMLAQGLLNKQIAYELGISEATTKAHVSAVLQKLNVDSRTQAVIRLSKIGNDTLQSDVK